MLLFSGPEPFGSSDTMESWNPAAKIGEEKNFQCAILHPRKVNETGYLGFGEGYTEGRPCKANFGSREKAEEVLKALLGEQWKEDDAKPDSASSLACGGLEEWEA